MRQGEIWLANLPQATGALQTQPLLLLQADPFTRSRLPTIIGALITDNLQLQRAPGNVLIPAANSGLATAGVVNVTQIVTVDKLALVRLLGSVDNDTLIAIKQGVRLVLGLN
jgi:mRNA interferase MazF